MPVGDRDATLVRRWRLVGIVACVVFIALVGVACEVWRRSRPHWAALFYYASRACKATWTCDSSNWQQGGSTTFVAGPYWPLQALTDDDLRYLQDLHRLETVDLSNALAITDAGLAHLRGLKHLDTLDLGAVPWNDRVGLRITDAGLVHLRNLTKLRELSLRMTATTDAGLGNLVGLVHLESLDLSHTEVSDTGLSHLRVLSRLESLDLAQTHVTDAGLKLLARLPRLRRVNVADTRVTRAAISALARLRPELEIESDFTGPEAAASESAGP